MTWALAAFCAAAVAIVAAATSMAVGLLFPWLDRAAGTLAPRDRARAWLWLGALPGILGVAVLAATLLPAAGLGVDHCLAHDPHHPHLCPHHLQTVPGLFVIAVASLLAIRAAHGIARALRAALLSARTSRTLADGSRRVGDLLVFESDEPQAFVLGLLSPRIHASTGLLALGPRVLEAVLAHERAHARRRDLLWRGLFSLLGVGHLPFIASRLARRIAAAQEMAADEEAACAVRDRVQVAEALVSLTRAQARACPGLSFTHGDVKARVKLLLDPGEASSVASFALAALVTGAVVAIGAWSARVHHAVETLLGALS